MSWTIKAGEFPPTFRKDLFAKIIRKVDRGQSVQLVGLSGSGVSTTLHAISESVEIATHHLSQKASNYKFVYMDFGLVPTKNVDSMLRFIANKIGIKKTEYDTNSVVTAIETEIANYLRSSKNRLILEVDSFENLINPELTPLFKVLNSIISTQHKGSISYIFGVGRRLSDSADLAKLSGFGALVAENIIYLPPLNDDEAMWLIDLEEKHMGRKLSRVEKEKIVKVSGGFMRTIKRVTQARYAGHTLDEISNNPSVEPHLNYHLNQLLDELGPERDTLRRLVTGRLEEADGANLQYLKQIHFLKGKRLANKVFETFLRNKLEFDQDSKDDLPGGIKINTHLSRSEYKLLDVLVFHKGKIVGREEIIIAVWGDKVTLGISNHALDQLIHRLREKLRTSKSKVKLQTIRGRGHRLIMQ